MENYFDLFSIPIQLKIEISALRPRFFELSRKFHPDFFVNRPMEEQNQALERTAQLNKAWKIFQQPDELLRYVMEINNYWQVGEKYELSPEFLMEMMEINEALMDSDTEHQEKLRDQIKEIISSILEPVQEYFAECPFVANPEKLSKLKEYYYRRKYIQRIEEQLAQMS